MDVVEYVGVDGLGNVAGVTEFNDEDDDMLEMYVYAYKEDGYSFENKLLMFTYNVVEGGA